jgi:hypothetical protein
MRFEVIVFHDEWGVWDAKCNEFVYYGLFIECSEVCEDMNRIYKILDDATNPKK